METTTTTINGKQRRSLAEQIDRLDGILDGLADALNESVATAVKDAVTLAVREAVQAVLTELLANPAVRELLQGGPPPADDPAAPPAGQPAGSSWGRAVASRLGRWARAAVRAASAPLRVAAGAGELAVQAGRRCLGWCRARLGPLRRLALPLLAAAGIGALAAVAVYHTGPWLVATAAGLGGSTAALAAQVLAGLRSLLAGRFGGRN
jgi:hypothetical protein